MSRRHVLSALAILAARPAMTLAQTFPQRPLKLVCPYPAGGSTDLSMRALALAAAKVLGHEVIVENKPGASGTLGVASMMASRPDGYTLAQCHVTVLRLAHLQKVSYDPLRDMSFVIGLTGYTYGLAVRADSPWKTLQDVVDWARAHPGQLTYGSSGGIGSGPHVGMELVAAKAGIRAVHVPFKGDADNMTSLLGGHTMLLSASTGFAPQVNDGRARLLATFGDRRTKSWPDVPTLREAGVDVVWATPWGIAGPAGMDGQIVRVLHDAFRAALYDESMQKVLDGFDQPTLYMSSADYAAFNRAQFDREREIVDRFGLRER